MVLESFIAPQNAKKNSWSLFFIGIIYSSIAILLSLIVFPNQASFFSIFLTTLATAPLFVLLLKDEESLHIEVLEKKEPIFREHLHILGVFFFIFLGYTVSFSLWFSFLPEWALNDVFSSQINDINAIQSLVSGDFIDFTTFNLIFQNNVRVMFFCLLFSFLYGAGAVLILSWNASILGSATGLFIRDRLSQLTGTDYLSNIAVYFSSLPEGLGRYMFHGIFEIFAYFIASLAGGLISAAVVRKRYKSRNFLKLLRNTSILTIGAILLLAIAAVIEVSV